MHFAGSMAKDVWKAFTPDTFQHGEKVWIVCQSHRRWLALLDICRSPQLGLFCGPRMPRLTAIGHCVFPWCSKPDCIDDELVYRSLGRSRGLCVGLFRVMGTVLI